MKTPIEFNNHLHAKYSKAYDESRITKEQYDEYLEYYKWVFDMFTKVHKK